MLAVCKWVGQLMSIFWLSRGWDPTPQETVRVFLGLGFVRPGLSLAQEWPTDQPGSSGPSGALLF